MSPHALGVHLEALQVKLETSWWRSFAPRAFVMRDPYADSMRRVARHIVKGWPAR